MLKSLTKSETLSSTGQVPVAVIIHGIPYWQANGRTFPLVAGAEDPPPADAEKDDDADDDEFDKTRWQALKAKLRDEAKAAKLEAKAAKSEAAALKAKEQERADADKSELEKAQARLAEREKAQAEAEAKLRRVLIAQAIERAATKANARNPEVVAKLIDVSALELDDEGKPTNADELVKALLKAEPYLVATDQTKPNGEGNGVPATPRSSGQPGHAEKVADKKQQLATSGNYAEL